MSYIIDGNMFSGLKDRDKDSYPDVFDDFPDDSTLWNDTDGDGWPTIPISIVPKSAIIGEIIKNIWV